MRYVVYSNFSKMSPETKSMLKNLGYRIILPAGMAALGGYGAMFYGSDTDNLEHLGSLLTHRPDSNHFGDYMVSEAPDFIKSGGDVTDIRKSLEALDVSDATRDAYNEMVYRNAPRIAKTGINWNEALLDPDNDTYKKLKEINTPLLGRPKGWGLWYSLDPVSPDKAVFNQDAYNAWQTNMDNKLLQSQELHDYIVNNAPKLQRGLTWGTAAAGAGAGLLANNAAEKAMKAYILRNNPKYSQKDPYQMLNTILGSFEGVPGRNTRRGYRSRGRYPRGYAYSFSNPASGLHKLVLSAALAFLSQSPAKADSVQSSAPPKEIAEIAETLPAPMRKDFIKEVCSAVRYFGSERKKLIAENNFTGPASDITKDPNYSVIAATVGNPDCLEEVKQAKKNNPSPTREYKKALNKVANLFQSDLSARTAAPVKMTASQKAQLKGFNEAELAGKVRESLVPNADVGGRRSLVWRSNGKFRLPPDLTGKESIEELLTLHAMDRDFTDGRIHGSGVNLGSWIRGSAAARKVINNTTIPDIKKRDILRRLHNQAASEIINQFSPAQFTDPVFLEKFIAQLKKSNELSDESAKEIQDQLEVLDPSLIKEDKRVLGEHQDSRSRGLSAVREVLKRGREKAAARQPAAPSVKPDTGNSAEKPSKDAGNKK